MVTSVRRRQSACVEARLGRLSGLVMMGSGVRVPASASVGNPAVAWSFVWADALSSPADSPGGTKVATPWFPRTVIGDVRTRLKPRRTSCYTARVEYGLFVYSGGRVKGKEVGMAKLVFGMNQSLDGFVDHMAFAPSPTLFRHFIEEAQGQAGSVYGRLMLSLIHI